MRRIFLSARVWLLLSICAATMLRGTESKPVLIIDYYPNRLDRGVIDWDCPAFAAYSDGRIIWRRGWARVVDALAMAQDEKGNQDVQKLGALVTAYDGKAFILTASSDPEGTTIWYLGKTLRIVGDWRKPLTLETELPENKARVASVNEAEKKLWSSLPVEIRTALADIEAFDSAKAQSWRPANLVVTLAPGGRGEPMKWPENWPHSFVSEPGRPEFIQAELPGSMLDELLSKLAQDGWPRAVMFDGKQMYAKIRLIFPGERAWKTQ